MMPSGGRSRKPRERLKPIAIPRAAARRMSRKASATCSATPHGSLARGRSRKARTATQPTAPVASQADQARAVVQIDPEVPHHAGRARRERAVRRCRTNREWSQRSTKVSADGPVQSSADVGARRFIALLRRLLLFAQRANVSDQCVEVPTIDLWMAWHQWPPL